MTSLRGVLFFQVLLFLAGGFCQGQDAAVSNDLNDPSSGGLTFGSRTVLSTLWKPEELTGKPEDKQVMRCAASLPQHPPQAAIPKAISSPLSPELQHSIRSVMPINGEKVIALTFDLCESATEKSGYDADIVNYLRENQIRATFFAGGKWMLSHPEKTLQLMADPLFEIGNHSWSHANFRTMDAGRMRDQILRTQAQYASFREMLRQRAEAAGIDPSEMNSIPKSIRLFRFPYGACSPEALDILRDCGLPAIQWDVVTGDPAPDRSGQEIARVILKNSRPGSIIICHANGRGKGTAASLPFFVPMLRAKGYAFLTVSELLARGPSVTSRECYERVPGDNRRYDRTTGKRQDANR